MLSLPDTI